MSQTTYISIDIEADGPVPGLHSMLSLGAVAFEAANPTPISAFTRNLVPLPGATQHPDTMEWWSKRQDLYLATTVDAISPDQAMIEFDEWISTLPGSKVAVGYPICFDWGFVNWYFHRFVGRNPLGISGQDIKSFASAILGTPYKETVKRKFPSQWDTGSQHTHVAIDDALEQGELLVNIQRHPRPPVWLSFDMRKDTNLWGSIKSGTLDTTVRVGHRNIRTGDQLVLGCPYAGVCVPAKVTDVHHTQISKLDPHDLTGLGHSSKSQLLETLREHYPKLSNLDTITLVRWKLIS